MQRLSVDPQNKKLPWPLRAILWAFGQWKWFALVASGITLVSWIALDWSEQRTRSREAFLRDYAQVQIVEKEFSALGRGVFDEANNGVVLSIGDAAEFRFVAIKLQDALSTIETPTSSIKAAEMLYRAELASLSGRLNTYDPTVKEIEDVLYAAEAVDASAFQFREAASNYVNSLWLSFTQVLF